MCDATVYDRSKMTDQNWWTRVTSQVKSSQGDQNWAMYRLIHVYAHIGLILNVKDHLLTEPT